MAKKAAPAKRARSSSSRSSGKRDLVSRRTGSSYAKRTATGRFKEMDDVGRSQKADKRKKARTRVSSGYGDQGDTSPRSRKKR